MEMGESQPIQNNEKLHVKEAVMTREAVTLAQIHNLLSIAGTMASIATRHTIEDEDGAVSMTEAQIAAENTFINACECLDKILTDSTRWNMEFQQQQEKLFQASQAAAINFRIRKIENEDAPHTLFPPTLYRTIDGKWMALLGSPDEPGAGVNGVGASPEEALKNFDAAFTGRDVSIDPVKWANELSKKHEQQKLDTSGTGSNSADALGGEFLGSDSGGVAGTDPGWLPDNQRPEAEGDGEGGEGDAGKPA